MDLRPSARRASIGSRKLARRRLPAALLPVLAALCSALFAGDARAAADEYPDPLHLSAAQSTEVTASTSYKLVGTAGLPPAASGPTVTATAGGSLTGAYRYVYTFVDPVTGETARSPSTERSTNAFLNLRQFTVSASGLSAPDGTPVRLYRGKGSDRFNFLVDLTVSAGGFSYLDNTADAAVNANPPLAQAENRVEYSLATPVTGYAAFEPGRPVTASTNDNSPVTESASTTPSGTGWLVDGPGNVRFAAGTWGFTVQTKSVHANGVARLVVGMWKATTSSGSIAAWELVLDPNDAAAQDDVNLITSSNVVQTITHSVDLPALTLAPDQQLYVQFWRRQVSAYTTSGGIESRIAILYANDGVAQLGHPAATTLPPAPGLRAPKRGAIVRTSTPRLKALYSDPDGDDGTVRFRICKRPASSGTACSKKVVAGSSATAASETVAAWTSTKALRDAAYHWQARSEDANGATSPWSTTRKLIVATQLIRITSYPRVKCAVGSRLAFRAFLARRAGVTAYFRTSGRLDHVRWLGRRDPGARRFRMRIPYTLERPAVYWVEVRATRRGETGSAWLRVEVRPLRLGEVDPPPCEPDL